MFTPRGYIRWVLVLRVPPADILVEREVAKGTIKNEHGKTFANHWVRTSAEGRF